MSRGGVVCVAVALSLLSMDAFADPPPIDAYASLQISSPRLSPDGNSIAMIGVSNNRQVLMVRGIDSHKLVLIATGESFPDWFKWKNSSRLLASVRFTTDLGNINAVVQTRLAFFNADGTNITPVNLSRLPTLGTAAYGDINRIPQIQDDVVSLLPHDPDHIMMAVTPENDFLHPDLALVDINSGRPHTVLRGSDQILDFYTDNDGIARAAAGIDRADWLSKETQRTVLVRSGENAPWMTIYAGDYNRPGGNKLSPLGLSDAAPNLFYVTTENEKGRIEARAYDIKAQSLGPVLAGDPDCDVMPLFHDYQVSGFRIPCQDHKTLYLDPGWQHDWDIVTKALKTNIVSIIDRSVEGKRSLAMAKESETAPPSFWLIDRSGEKTDVRWMGMAYEKVPRDQIAETKSVGYSARDGLTIPALLTLPVNHAEGALPFVVFPHGGPTANDDVRFDWIVQFLASRGYGVLQPQFRGSTGYGAAFQQAGLGQWGLVMQDDVTDGTRWLIEQKLAEPGRICIAGASYGGYSALMGVVKEPGLYACAAAFAPVTDIDSFLYREKQFAFDDINIPRIKGDKQGSDAISPSENAEKIRVPVLLMHGKKDYTVAIEQSEIMERALKRAGKPVEAIYLEGADHYFSQGSDRTAWLTALEKLLSSTIGTKQ